MTSGNCVVVTAFWLKSPLRTRPCSPSVPPASGMCRRGTAVLVARQASFSSSVISDRMLSTRCSSGRVGVLKRILILGVERRHAGEQQRRRPRAIVAMFMAITRIISLCGDPHCDSVCWPASTRASRCAQDGENVLLVVNRASTLSRHIADYYIPKRGIPLKNVCKLDILAGQRRDLLGHLRGASRAAHRPLPGQGRSARAGALHRHHHGRAAEGRPATAQQMASRMRARSIPS